MRLRNFDASTHEESAIAIYSSLHEKISIVGKSLQLCQKISMCKRLMFSFLKIIANKNNWYDSYPKPQADKLARRFRRALTLSGSNKILPAMNVLWFRQGVCQRGGGGSFQKPN